MAVSSSKFPALKGVKAKTVVWDKKRKNREKARKKMKKWEAGEEKPSISTLRKCSEKV